MAACWCPLPSHPWWYSENILSLWIDHHGRQLMVLRFRLPKSIKIDLQDFKIISLDPQSGSENLWLGKLILQLPISELPPFSASYTHFLCAKVTLEIQNYQPLSKMIKKPTLIVSGASEPVHRFPTGSSARAAFTSRNQGPSIAINLSHNIAI